MRTSIALAFAAPVVVAAALGAACATDGQAALKSFIAPDFSRIDDTRLQDAMWRLGNGVQQLNDVFVDASLDDAGREARAVEVLTLMEEAAASVNKEPQKQRHQNVAMNIDKLMGDISAAKAAAQNHDLVPAQALPATCLACHQGGGGGAQK
jgi:hypothetical protein